MTEKRDYSVVTGETRYTVRGIDKVQTSPEGFLFLYEGDDLRAAFVPHAWTTLLFIADTEE